MRVHPQAHDPVGGVSLGQVRKPAAAKIEDGDIFVASGGRKRIGVEGREGGDRARIDVRHHSRRRVEGRIGSLIQAPEVPRRERKLLGPRVVHKHFVYVV